MINIKELFSKMKLTERLIIASYYYLNPCDQFIFDDVEYDALKNKLPLNHPFRYLNWDTLLNIYDIESLLQHYNLPIVKNKIETNGQSDSEETPISSEVNLNRLRSQYSEARSVQMVQDMQPVYEEYLPQLIDYCFNNQQDLELMFSFKMDGWNITSYFDKGLGTKNDDTECVFYSHSRGRTTDNVADCTTLMKQLTPSVNLQKAGLDEFAIRGELCMSRSGLSILKNAYPNKSLMNVRNSVSALVHQTVDIGIYNNNVAKYFAFNILLPKQEQKYKTMSELFDALESMGFTTPYHKLLKVSFIPNKQLFTSNVLNEFNILFNHMEEVYLNNTSLQYEADGCIIQPNNTTLGQGMSNLSSGNFDNGLLAIKAGRVWGKKIYRSKVTSIYYSKARVSKAVMCTIEPTQSNLGTIVTRVELDNLRNACLVHDVRVGDTIEFTMHSQQIIQILKNVSAIERNNALQSDDVAKRSNDTQEEVI